MKKGLLIGIIMLISNMIVAQSKVSGTVVDDKGESLPGVTVQEKGTTNGTISDVDGKFSLNVASDATLMFSSMGFKNQEVLVNGRTIFNINLATSVSELDEVIVVGYGTQSRTEITGAVSTLNTDVLKNRPLVNFEDALRGQIPGLDVSSTGGQPGAETKMNIRGIASVSGSSQPLIVVDGFPLNEVSNSAGGGLDEYSGKVGAFAFINPADIESVEVLKDASATAIYGNRGAKGVILITTKKGRKGQSGITFSSYFGVHQMKKRLDVMDFTEYVDYQQTLNPGNRLFTSEDGELFEFPEADKMNVDWQDEIYRRGAIQNYTIGVQGKSKETSYSLSASYTKDQSILINTNFEKITSRLALDHQFSDKVAVGSNITYSRIINNGPPTGGREGTAAGLTISALTAAPFRMDNNTASRFRRAGVNPYQIDQDEQSNIGGPRNLADNTQLDKIINRAIANLYVDVAFTDWLSFKSTLGLDFFTLVDQQYYAAATPWGALNNGVGTSATVNARNLLNENYFTLSKQINDHRFNLVSGFSFQQNISDFTRAEGRDFQNESLGYNSLQSAAEWFSSTSADKWALMSYYARANYTYDNRYSATFTVRRDGSSRFALDKWGTFYSGSAAWNVHNESFMSSNNMISNLKLRGSIGQTGNASVPLQGALLDQQFSNYTFGGQFANGVAPSSLENRNLTWETTTQYNMGLDLGVFDNSLSFTAEYFVKKTTDLLLFTPLSISTGFENGWLNIGEIANTGIELSLGYDLRTQSGLTWNTSINMTSIQNEIKALGGDGQPIYIDVNFDGIYSDEVILEVGGSINDFFGYKSDGLYLPEDFDSNGDLFSGVPTAGSGEQPGDIKFKDISGPDGTPDGLIDGYDRTKIGNSLPKAYGSWNNSFGFKGFELDIILQYSYGNDVFNATKTKAGIFFGNSENQFSDWLNRWTPENPNSTQYAGIPVRQPADFLIEDASFIRLQMVRLGYNLPSKWISNYGIKNAKMYVAANNLAVFTNYSGYDPEVTTNQSSAPFVQGIDYGAFPRAKTYMAGINIQF